MNRSNLFISGSGRSGTTWLLDSVAVANGLRTVFEPLHPLCGKPASAYSQRWLGAEDDAPELATIMSSVFENRYDSLWTDYRIRPDRLRADLSKPLIPEARRVAERWFKLSQNIASLRPSKRFERPIVKEIRGNFLLSWLQALFQTRIVHVVRHPLAVILSKEKAGLDNWDSVSELSSLREQAERVACDSVTRELLMRTPASHREAHCILWALENRVALNDLQSDRSTCVYYECIRNEPQQWRRVIDVLELENVPADDVLARRSNQSYRESTHEQSDNKVIERWREAFEPSELRVLTGIWEAGGFGEYTPDSLRPKFTQEFPEKVSGSAPSRH